MTPSLPARQRRRHEAYKYAHHLGFEWEREEGDDSLDWFVDLLAALWGTVIRLRKNYPLPKYPNRGTDIWQNLPYVTEEGAAAFREAGMLPAVPVILERGYRDLNAYGRRALVMSVMMELYRAGSVR